MIRVVHPGSRIRMLTFYPSRIPDPDADFLPIPDPGVKKAPDPGSRIRNTVFPFDSCLPNICHLPSPLRSHEYQVGLNIN